MAGGGATREGVRQEMFLAKPESHVVLLRGQDGDVRFPPICPNCQSPASGMGAIQRAFVFHVPSESDTPNSSEPVVNTLRVPFCPACAALHRTQGRAWRGGDWTFVSSVGVEALLGCPGAARRIHNVLRVVASALRVEDLPASECARANPSRPRCRLHALPLSSL